jgi:hypothetical protein
MNLLVSRDALLLIGLFYVLPMVDLLTGALLFLQITSEGGLASPSQLFRMMLFGLCATRLKLIQAGVILCIISICVFSEYLGSFTHQSPYGLGIGVVNLFKISYIVCVSFVAVNWLTDGKFTKQQILSHALNGTVIYATNVVLAAIFGLGEKTYGAGTFGVKGFVASNNGLSLTLGCALILSLMNQHTFWEKFRSLAILAGTLLIGAKASIAFVLTFLVVTFFRAKTWEKSAAIAIGIVVILQFYHKLKEIFNVMFDVIVFRYKNFGGDIAGFLASGRDNYIEFAFSSLSDSFTSIGRIVFGQGALVSFHNLETMRQLHDLGGGGIRYETLETDLFDILFQYGALVAILYVGVIAAISIRSFQMRNWVLLLAWIMMCMFSVLAGHTVFNGMSATMIILIVAMSSKSTKYNLGSELCHGRIENSCQGLKK